MDTKRFLVALIVGLWFAPACGGGGGSSPDEDTGDVVEDADLGDVAEDTDVDATDSDIGPDSDDGDADADVANDASDGGTDADAGEPTCPSEWPTIEPSAQMDFTDPAGPDPAVDPPAGEARGGQVRTDEILIEGPRADCRRGDWILANDNLRACISGPTPVTSLMFDGGALVDLESTDHPGGDEFFYMRPFNNALPAATDRVELVRDGTDGGVAVVRVEGPDSPILFFAANIGDILPRQNLRYVTEYRLAPDAEAIEVVTWIERESDRNFNIAAGDLVAPGDTTTPWYGERGITDSTGRGPVSLYAAIGEDRSYGVYSETLQAGRAAIPGVEMPMGDLMQAPGFACPGTPVAFRRYVTVGTGDTASLRERLASYMPDEDTTEVTFEATLSDVWPDPRYHIVTAEDAGRDVVRLDDGGEATLSLPAGDYVARALDWPLEDGGEVSFSVPADGTIELPVPDLGWLELELIDERGAPSAAQIRDVNAVAPIFFSVDGDEQVPLPAGEYTLEISRGEEFDVHEATVTVVAGEGVPVEVSFTRQMQTEGWMSADFHQHQTASLDSRVPNQLRVRSNIAVGVEIISPSDHDGIGDFQPAIDALGLADRLHLFQGIEVSTGAGHFGAYPVPFDRALPNGGAVMLGEREVGTRDWTVRTVPELVDIARGRGAELFQLNHVRGLALALFDTVDYDPVTGPAGVDSEQWFDDFDTMEIYNETQAGDSCEIMRDWFSLLRWGERITGVGNSDTHNTVEPVGFPRNYMHVGLDDPATVDNDDILGALLAQRVSVSGGVFIRFTDGTLPGDLVEPVDGTVSLPVQLQSPTWAWADELIVYVDGIEQQRIAIDSEAEDLIDIETTIDVDVSADGFIVLLAVAAEDMTSVVANGHEPMGFTNPVYVDADGDGAWTAPGVSSAEDVPMPTGIPFCE